VLGLNIDPRSDAIGAGVRFQSDARMQRARRIGERLEKRGIEGAFEGAATLASGHYIGRPHFAQHVINIGKAKDMNAAFKNYLGDGKAGDVRQHWASLAQIIEWIRGAGGIAVLAHPLKYKLTRTRLRKLLADFVALGGEGLEVVSGQQTPQHTSGMVQVCVEMGLLASCGSDFHMPGKRWAELGSFSSLPPRVTPVWDRF
jgi:predicted metal-dependent phosphoesterase TrpH